MQRRLISDAIRELDSHATAEQVYGHIHKSHPTVSKATVYRNLRQMSESGELANIGSFRGSARFDHKLREHYHFACDACDKIFDVGGDLSGFINKMDGLDGFDVKKYSLSLGGLCRDCKNKAENKKNFTAGAINGE